MGNTFNKDNDTINWNSLKTENIGDDNGQLTYDSKLLLNRLQIDLPKNIKSETDSEIDKFFSKYKTVESTENIASLQKPVNQAENLSDTSPFISSDMYKYLMKSNNQENKENEMKGGGVLDGDDSSTSSTSSSSDEKDKKPKPKLKKYKGKKIETEQSEKTEQSSEKISMDSDAEGLSYVSSSAHTGGGDNEESNSNSEQSGVKSEHSEQSEQSEQSGGKDLDSSSEASEYDADEFDQSGGDSEEESSDYISSTERPNKKNSKKKSKTKSKNKAKNISKKSYNKSYKSKSVTKSITNENSALPPSSINTSDINMITEN